MVVVEVELHSAGIVDLRCDLVRVVRVLRRCLSHLPQLQQDRERLHLRFAHGVVRTCVELLASL